VAAILIVGWVVIFAPTDPKANTLYLMQIAIRFVGAKITTQPTGAIQKENPHA
jgi:hypothetical protein